MMQRLGRLGVLAGLCLALVAPALPAGAHANLVRSVPAAGAELDAAPTTVRVFFDAEIESTSTIEVVGVDATPVAGTGGLDLDDLDRRALVFTADTQMPDGGYVVRYAAVMVADGDTTEGVIPFGVGVPAPPARSVGDVSSRLLSPSAAVSDGAAPRPRTWRSSSRLRSDWRRCS